MNLHFPVPESFTVMCHLGEKARLPPSHLYSLLGELSHTFLIILTFLGGISDKKFFLLPKSQPEGHRCRETLFWPFETPEFLKPCPAINSSTFSALAFKLVQADTLILSDGYW